MATADYWALVHAKAHQEAVAERNLARQGFRCFLPKRLRAVRHARRERHELRAYFPSYLFVRIDPDATQWRPINSTIGVLRLVTNGVAPMRAPEGFVESLAAHTDAAGLVQLKPRLRRGQRVRVARGPFLDQLGVIDELSDPDRVRVLLDMMTSKAAVSVSAGDLSVH